MSRKTSTILLVAPIFVAAAVVAAVVAARPAPQEPPAASATPDDLHALEGRIEKRLDALADSIDALHTGAPSRGEAPPSMGSHGAVPESAPHALPSARQTPPPMNGTSEERIAEETAKKVLHEMDRRKEEERVRRTTAQQQMVAGLMLKRVETFGNRKGWNPATI
ncbi:MAG: hypothetical protein ACYTAF_14615, partial [Planctomycetota bacterium]